MVNTDFHATSSDAFTYGRLGAAIGRNSSFRTAEGRLGKPKSTIAKWCKEKPEDRIEGEFLAVARDFILEAESAPPKGKSATSAEPKAAKTKRATKSKTKTETETIAAEVETQTAETIEPTVETIAPPAETHEPTFEAGADAKDDPAEIWRRAAEAAGNDNPYLGRDVTALVAAAEALDRTIPADRAKAKQIIEAAVDRRLTGLDAGSVRDAVAAALGARAKDVSDEWKDAEAVRARLNPPDEAEEARAREEEAAKRRAELELLAAPIIADPKPFARFEKLMAARGVVAEKESVKAVALAANSRVLDVPRVVSILRTGLTGAGKSYLIQKVLEAYDADIVFRMTVSSQRALIYATQEDPNFLRHKIVHLEEAAGAVAGSDGKGDDNVFTAVLRSLLTQGVADAPVVIKGDDGRFRTEHIHVEGPISLITSSARDVFDPEMMNRVVSISADESHAQTSRIVDEIVLGATRTKSENSAELAAWRAFQSLLQLDAPFRVSIPFNRALRAAIGTVPRSVRFRRDITVALLGIMSSAVTHRHHRSRDAEGRIEATLEDYAIAREAFDKAFAGEYGLILSPGAVALVKGVEELIAKAHAEMKAEAEAEAGKANKPVEWPPKDFSTQEPALPPVKITTKDLERHLSIRSAKTISARVKEAEAAQAIKRHWPNRDFDSSFGNQSAKFEVIVPSADLRRRSDRGLMPTVAELAAYLADPEKTETRLRELRTEKLDAWNDEIDEGDAGDEAERGGDGSED